MDSILFFLVTRYRISIYLMIGLSILSISSMNLTVKSGGKETLYDNEVLIKKSIPNGNNTGKQKKTFVVDYATKPDDAVPFILLHFSSMLIFVIP
jgi:hypothetical protein